MTSAVIRISKTLDERLSTLADKTGRKKTYYAQKALERFLEDMEDYYLGLAAMEESKENFTLEEATKKLGMADKDKRRRSKDSR